MESPKLLTQLAQNSLEDYISSLCTKLTECKKKNGLEETKTVCGRFNMFFVKKVPPVLATDVSCGLLTAIDDWIANKIETVRIACGVSIESEIFKDDHDILQEVVKCVVHPAVTRLAAMRDTVICSDLFSCHTFRSKTIVVLLGPLLPSLTKLRKLNIHSENKKSHTNVFIPKKLEEYSGCADDEVLKEIVEGNPSLKLLDIENSERVTSKSVRTILNLSCLERLNVARTNIKEHGKIYLLQGLSRMKNLKELKIHVSATSKQLQLFRSHLSHVTLSIIWDGCERGRGIAYTSWDLQELENLRALEINIDVTLFEIQMLFNHVMGRLTFLKLTSACFDCTEEFMEFCKMVTNLKCLHLNYFVSVDSTDSHPSEYIEDESDYEDDLDLTSYVDSLQGFKCLKCCEISSLAELTNTYRPLAELILGSVMKQGININKLVVNWHACFCELLVFMESIFKRNDSVLNKLKEIYVDSAFDCGKCNGEGFTRFLRDRCPELKIIRGVK